MTQEGDSRSLISNNPKNSNISVQFMNWSSTDKCLAISVVAAAFCIFYGVAVEALLKSPNVLEELNRESLALGKKLLPWITLGWIFMIVFAYRSRKTAPDSIVLVYLTLAFYSIPNTFLVYLLGPVTSPLVGVALVGTGVVSMLLFDLKPALIMFVFVVLALITLTVAERLGLIGYAPLLTVEPTINGRPSNWWVVTWGGLSLIVALALVAIFAWLVNEWKQRDALLEALSSTDGLTELTNRRRFMEIIEAECERAKRTNRPVSLVMCDADHFKSVNDTYGHHVGDEVLKVIASVLKESVRVSTDVPARLGGEEFALLLAETDMESAKAVAARIVEGMREQTFTANEEEFKVTLSAGLCTLSGKEVDVNELMETSDKLLYKAKNSGRNRFEFT